MATLSETTIKVLVIGDSTVGKTSFVRRVTENKFSENYLATFGVELGVKKIQRGDLTISLALWDIAGQESFNSIIPSYTRKTAGIIIIADVSNRETVDSVKQWKRKMDELLLSDPPTILIINKFDKPKQLHTVTTEELIQIAQDFNIMKWYQTSVKDNKNVNETLEDMVDFVLQCDNEDNNELATGIKISGKEYNETNDGCTC